MPEENGRVNILGVGFDNVTLEEATERAVSFLDRSEERGYIVTPNSEIVHMCKPMTGLAEALNGAAMVLPDGIGVVHASKILKRPLKGKVAGVDFAASLMDRLKDRSDGLFLLGAKPGVAVTAAEKLRERFPGLQICGMRDGYFKEDQSVIDQVNKSGASVLFVCLGAPRQELWMQNHLEQLNVKLMVGLGGSLDVFAGTVKRAPDIWVKLGLEWLYRLIREPWRFKRMCKLPLFLCSAIAARMQGE